MQSRSTAATSRAFSDAAATIVGSVLTGLMLGALLGGNWFVQVAGFALGLMVPSVAALSVLRRTPPNTTGADRVTLLRGVLTGACATVVVLSVAGELNPRSWPLFVLALPAVVLDAVDGWVARRSNNASADGGRLDMETDAILLLVLCVPLAISVGPWTLAIGAMRYAFVAGSWLRPAWRQGLAFSQFRRVVAGTQGVVLAAAVLPIMPVPAAAVATATALVLLIISFGKDIRTLERAKWQEP
ncbi:MAG: CDP-alcohol phosphatidyltransferase family protein [Arachnia sp.]